MARKDAGRGRRLPWAVAITVLGLACFSPPAWAVDIQVDSLTDESMNDGSCSLRQAIKAAADNSAAHESGCEAGAGAPGLDRVVLGAGEHSLAGAADEDANASGDLDVDAGATPGPLEIVGQGAADSLIDSCALDRAIQLLAGTLTITDLGIEDCGAPSGNNPGGAIRASVGTLMLDGVDLNDNDTPEEGGAVSAGSGVTLAVTDSTISSNESDGDGGGINAAGPTTVSDSTITGNRAIGNEGGGLTLTAAATITGSTVSNNTTDDPDSLTDDDGDVGGGIEFDPSAPVTLTITDSTISGNFAELQGGGAFLGASASISMSGSTVFGNSVNNDQAEDPTGGAGLSLGAGTITASTVGSNTSSTSIGTSEAHGAILKAGTGVLAIKRSTVAANSVGGGLSQEGGGISAQGGTLNLVNSTVSDNTATVGGGVSLDATAKVLSTTFGDNHSTDSHSIFDQGTVEIGNSIIYDLNGPVACTTSDLISLGNNVAVGTSCVDGSVGGDLPNTVAGLLPLASNGGPTQTHGITSTSPAVNRVPTAACVDESPAALVVDQRGLGRPAGGFCDSGAFELQTTDIPPTQPPPQQTQPKAEDPACAGLRKKLKKAKTKKAKRKIRGKLKKKGCP
jgi:CSLREA domain-containing protein